MQLQIIVGSIREGRISLPVAQWAQSVAAAQKEWSAEILDLKDWALPMFDLRRPPALGSYEDPAQIRWAETIARGDAYIFVSPEYNHGYSAVLKNALDYLYAEWGRKPAAIISFGNVGGARGVEQLRLVLVELRMAPVASALHLRDLRAKLEGGAFVGDEDDETRFVRLLSDLAWWARSLKQARESRTIEVDQ